ncbi:MAG: CCA tRNA nucleotidyltransferase [Chitinophagaceae bacterium]|jgi:putative nucleotidyltransferase with HDIG domain|nr:CCA tRNA nucleotidyltransferase [Chitinophagaceae bacterium]
MQIELNSFETLVARRIGKKADETGVEAWIIGGFVRDKILGRPTEEMDIVCVGDGIALAHAVADSFLPRPRVSFFKTFGTAQIKLMGLTLEFVGARRESYRTNSRKPEVEPGTLEDDQKRRDLTINALAFGLNEGQFGKITDPFNGLKHLREGILTTPLDPEITFSDDPLRMMRAIRFAAQLGFMIHPVTLQAITTQKERISIVSKERVADELNKIVLSPRPSVGFDLLYKTGLLHIFFPQMVALAGAAYIDGLGHKDNFYHTLQVLDNIAENTDDLWLRWAAILHDIGKPATKKFEEGHGWTFHGHEVVGARMVPKIFAQLKLPLNEKMRYVEKLVLLHLRPISLTKENITDSAIRRLLFDAGEDFEDLMTLCAADITSKNKAKVRRFRENFELVKERCAEVEQKDHLRNWQPPVDGNAIMDRYKLPQGHAVGILKTALKDAILDGKVANTTEAAYAFLDEEVKKLNLTNA